MVVAGWTYVIVWGWTKVTGLTIEPDWTVVAKGLPVVTVDGFTTKVAPLKPDPIAFWLENWTLPDYPVPVIVSNFGIEADVP